MINTSQNLSIEIIKDIQFSGMKWMELWIKLSITTGTSTLWLKDYISPILLEG